MFDGAGSPSYIAGITIVDPGADVVITNSTGSLWPKTIDMSSASRDLRIVNNSIYWEDTIQTVNVASVHTLALPTVVMRKGAATTINGDGTVAFGGNWAIGASTGLSTGILNFASGILSNTANNQMQIGTASSGIINHTGGEAYLYDVVIGGAASVPFGKYRLSGGKLLLQNVLYIINSAALSGEYVQSGASVAACKELRIASAGAVGATASLIISNGTFYATNFANFASQASTTGSIWLAGGTTTLPAFPTTRGSGAYADITFDGGTLVPNTNNCSTYLQGLNHAYLTANGAFLDTAGNSVTVSQVLENATSQIGKLTKVGAGTLTLAGANTYSGNTTVSNGVLKIAGSGSISNSPVINVAVVSATCDVSEVSGGWTVLSNQTLTGLGVVTGTVVTIVSNGIISPGTAGVAGGTLTINGTNTFLNGAKLNLDYSGATIDALTVNGVLNLPSNMTLTLSGSGRFSKVNVMNCAALAMSSTNFSGWTINGGPSGVRAVYDNAGHIQLVSPTGGIIMLQ
jgi:autotransporter-associated beta strand protein